MVADAAPNPKTSVPRKESTPSQCFQRMYSLKDEHIATMFHLLNKYDTLKLPGIRKPEEVEKVDDPKDHLYRRHVSHPIKARYILTDKILTLVDVNVIQLKP